MRAYLLHYASLLDDFRKSVEFIQKTANPATATFDERQRNFSQKLLESECNHLISQIDRLQKSRVTWDHRLANIMQLVGPFLFLQPGCNP